MDDLNYNDSPLSLPVRSVVIEQSGRLSTLPRPPQGALFVLVRRGEQMPEEYHFVGTWQTVLRIPGVGNAASILEVDVYQI
jgi:hypothetical protein